MPDYAAQRLNMVDSQVRTSDVTDVRIHAAMLDVPRERFVPAARRALAYSDTAVELVPNRYLLDPRIFAKMLNLATIAPADRVLDVGCATGYSAAVLARLAAKVTGLEQDADLVRIASDMVQAVGAVNVTIAQGSLSDGHKQGAPYDAIVIEGAVEKVPETLLGQLAEGGRLVAVVQKGAQGQACLYLRDGGRIGHRAAFDASTPLLAGFRQPVGFVL
jgi:protein-L-isoaspartate(D-aspartate) O-methyltransferase